MLSNFRHLQAVANFAETEPSKKIYALQCITLNFLRDCHHIDLHLVTVSVLSISGKCFLNFYSLGHVNCLCSCEFIDWGTGQLSLWLMHAPLIYSSTRSFEASKPLHILRTQLPKERSLFGGEKMTTPSLGSLIDCVSTLSGCHMCQGLSTGYEFVTSSAVPCFHYRAVFTVWHIHHAFLCMTVFPAAR